MRYIINKVTAIAAFFATFACIGQNQSSMLYSSAEFQLKEITINQADIRAKIYLVVIDPNKMKSKIYGLTKNYPSGRSSIGLINNESIQIIIGSGFVQNYFPLEPNGFLKIDGITINSLKDRGYNGIIGVKNSKLILTNHSSQLVSTLQEGFQSGPTLIRDGRIIYDFNSPKANELAKRAFIGINAQNKIIAAIVTTPISLKNLASILLNPINVSDLKCKNSINLSGGGAETLVVKTKDRVYPYGNTELDQAALLTFYK